MVDDVTEHDFVQLITDYFARLNLNAGVQKLLAVSNLMSDHYRHAYCAAMNS